MEREEIKSIVEALIFVAEEPIGADLITMVMSEAGVSEKDVRTVLDELVNEYERSPERGIRIVEVAGGYQFRTKPKHASFVQKLNVPKPVRLSQAAMETLAIIAYRQPVIRSEVENIRGVDSGGVLKTLLERGLIRIVGKSDEVGNPLLYGTTKAFLEMFGLKNLKELPALKGTDELGVQERVGDLGKDYANSKNGAQISEGVSDVIEEYCAAIDVYCPDPEKEAADDMAIRDLEDSIRNLRRIERDIFSRPVGEITAVPKAGESDEGAASQDTGAGDTAIAPGGGEGDI